MHKGATQIKGYTIQLYAFRALVDFLSFTSKLTWTWLMRTLTTTMILFDLFVIVADSSGVNLFSECG